MKRITDIFLKFFYPIPAIVVTVSAHCYCGKITSVSFNPFDTKHKYPCCSKKMKKDCCKDEITTIKLDGKQQKTQAVFCKVVKVTDFKHTISTSLTFDYKTPFLLTEFDNSTQPPDDLKHPLYIRYCVLRI